MAVKLSPVFQDAQLDSSGNPYVGAQLFTYVAGSTTPQTTYQDSAGSTQHTNPIVLNARGEPPAPIWLTQGSAYKLYLTTPTDSDPPVTSVRVIDNVRGVNDATVSIDEWIDSGLTPTYVSAASFTLAGDQTTEFHEGRRLKITDSGGSKYVTVTTTAYAALTTVTVAGDALASPTSAVSLSLLRANNPSVSSEMVYRKGAAVASAATCDIWNTQGDFIHITGSTGPITSFGTAPYTGAQKTLIFDSTPTITHNATSLFIPGGTLVVAAGDIMVVRADTAANMVVASVWNAARLALHGKCQLTKSSTNLLLSPCDGNTIIINSKVETIPDAGVTLAPPAVASTTYYIYAFMNSGTMTLEQSATTPAAQAGTGVKIKTGDATRSLVGMARTTSGNAWADSATQIFVLSYFNRRCKSGQNFFTADRTTTSTSYVELNSEIRIEALTWGDESVRGMFEGHVANSGANNSSFSSIGIDGATAEESFSGTQAYTNGAVGPFSASLERGGAANAITEGYHYFTGLGKVNGGTGTWDFTSAAAGDRSNLKITVRG